MKSYQQKMLAYACFAALAGQAQAGTASFDFDSDPSANGELTLHGTALWYGTGGNPDSGGYLSVTDAGNGQRGAIVFSDFDNELVVKAFSFSMDVRVGGGTDSPADGFSINYVRSNDPVLNDPLNGWAAGLNGEANLPEEGATTGLAVGFDSWNSGSGDVIGISIRVDNQLLTQIPFPVLNGACGNTNSLQTGPQNLENPGSPDLLCWQPFGVNLTEDGKLTVMYKSMMVVSNLQTTFAPSPGRLVFVGRTGDANQNHHVDNIRITTVPANVPVVGVIKSFPCGFTLELQDSGPSTVNQSSISLRLNGTPITATSITKSGITTLITYTAGVGDCLASGSTNEVSVSFNDNQGTPVSGTRQFTTPLYTTLTPALAVPASSVDKTKPGFAVRTVQTAIGNDTILGRAEDQLAGLLGENLADLTSADAQGSISVPGVINFDAGTTGAGNFLQPATPDSLVPGLPGAGPNGSDNAASEVLTFLEFPTAGAYSMGVNSDDGFRVTTGTNPKDRFAVNLGEFDGGRGATDTIFNFVIPQPGIYPFRLIWMNGTGGANYEWFSVLPDGSKVLINDESNPSAIKAYAAGPQGPAYVSRVFPYQNLTGVRADTSIEVKLTDAASQVDPASILIGLNGPPTAPTTVSQASGVTTATLASTGMLPSNATNTVTLVYADKLAAKFSNTWQFVTTPYATLSTDLSSPIGSGGARGFRVKVQQIAPEVGTAVTINSFAEQQLLGLFGANVADLSAAGQDGYFVVTNTINWNRDANGTGAEIGNFQAPERPDAPVPGLPGSTGSYENVATEIKTYVEFPAAGYYTMGFNSDDGFQVTSAEGPGPRIGALEILSPASLAGRVGAVSGGSDVGGITPPLPVTNTITAQLVYAQPGEACGAITNASELAGKIALVDRGTCTFTEKILAVKAAGAIAVLVANNRVDVPIVLGGTAADLPGVMISQADATRLKTRLAAGDQITVSLGEDPTPVLGEFNAGRGSADTLFSFVVPAPGLYPFRALWSQGTGGANAEWFSVTASGQKVLLNDTTADALKTYRQRTVVSRPTAAIALAAGGNVTISWTGAGTLEEAAAISGPWTPAGSQANPQTVPATGTKFYRIRQ